VTTLFRLTERGMEAVAGPCPGCNGAGVKEHNVRCAESGERVYCGKVVRGGRLA